MQSEVTSGFADVNGTRLYYEEIGQGVPVVLIHGLCLSSRMWDEQVDVLARRFRVIRYDVRGFGRSAVPTSRAFRHADDLRALLDHLDAPLAHVVGLSMGGRIALHHALVYPQATRALVLVDSALDAFEWDESWEASLDAIEACAKRDGAKAANAMWLAHELFAASRENPHCSSKLAEIVGNDSAWIWLHESPVQGIDPPARARLKEIQAPTLILVGERDLADFHRIADILAAEIPNATRVTLAGAGHMSNMEEPSAFNALLLEFLTAH